MMVGEKKDFWTMEVPESQFLTILDSLQIDKFQKTWAAHPLGALTVHFGLAADGLIGWGWNGDRRVLSWSLTTSAEMMTQSHILVRETVMVPAAGEACGDRGMTSSLRTDLSHGSWQLSFLPQTF